MEIIEFIKQGIVVFFWTFFWIIVLNGIAILLKKHLKKKGIKID